MDRSAEDLRKYALVIGIDQYPNFADSMQLEGCVNDAMLMRAVLVERFCFPSRNITMLCNVEATQAGIRTAMTALQDRVQKDAVVVVHYSGHGSRKGVWEDEERIDWDETIVPYDSGREPADNLDITDDEIYNWLLDLSTITRAITLIFDSCFSGSITRDSFGNPIRRLPEDPRPPAELSRSPTARIRGFIQEAGPSGWLPQSERYVLLAGCRRDEHACELHRAQGAITQHGAFTFFLARELLRAESEATYRDVFERASGEVTALFPLQHPQLEAARDRELFGVKIRPPMRFLPVLKHEVNRVILGGGAAHGLTVGSEWGIYPQGTKRVDTAASLLGSVRVDAVYAVNAEAMIKENNPKSEDIVAGCRAFEQVHSYGRCAWWSRSAVMVKSSRNFGVGSRDLTFCDCQRRMKRVR